MRNFLTKFESNELYNDFLFSSNMEPVNVSLVGNKIYYGIKSINNYFSIDDLKNNKYKFLYCEYFYEDENNNIILNFKSLTYDEVISFNEYNIAPYLAKHLGIYNKGVRIGEINIDFIIKEFGERKYRVGLMSDVHYNDFTTDSETGTISFDGSEYENDFPNALSFYQNKEDVKFICAAGDLSSNNIINVLNFRKALDQHAPSTNFYSCFGNHDYAAVMNPVDDNVIHIQNY